jgi:hypothetical protein
MSNSDLPVARLMIVQDHRVFFFILIFFLVVIVIVLVIIYIPIILIDISVSVGFRIRVYIGVFVGFVDIARVAGRIGITEI